MSISTLSAQEAKARNLRLAIRAGCIPPELKRAYNGRLKFPPSTFIEVLRYGEKRGRPVVGRCWATRRPSLPHDAPRCPRFLLNPTPTSAVLPTYAGASNS